MSPQVSWTLLSNLTDLDNPEVWMIIVFRWFTFPLKLFLNIWETFQVNQWKPVLPSSKTSQFFSFLRRSMHFCLSFQIFLFLIYDLPWRQNPLDGNSSRWHLFFFLLSNTSSSLLEEISWPLLNSKNKGILYLSFSWKNSGLCIYYFVDGNFFLWGTSQWITFATLPLLILYIFCAYLAAFVYYGIYYFILVSI